MKYASTDEKKNVVGNFGLSTTYLNSFCNFLENFFLFSSKIFRTLFKIFLKFPRSSTEIFDENSIKIFINFMHTKSM